MGYTHGIKWSYQKMCDEVNSVMYALNINRMPSNSECQLITGNGALSNAIRRYGGFYWLADHMGLDVKKSETETGKKFEKLAVKILEDKNYAVKRMTTKYPFDLLINDRIRIDVKAGRPYLLRGSRVHTIGINKKYATCDLYLIFALDEKDKPERTFIIPGCDLRLTTLNFGKDSIYNIYLNRWDLIRKYDEFYSNLASVRAGD